MYYICSSISNFYLPVSDKKYPKPQAERLAIKRTYEGTGLRFVAVPCKCFEEPIPQLKEEIDCPECNGACYVECTFYGSYEVGMAQCETCDGAGTVFVDDIPQQNILPAEVLTSSNELPF